MHMAVDDVPVALHALDLVPECKSSETSEIQLMGFLGTGRVGLRHLAHSANHILFIGREAIAELIGIVGTLALFRRECAQAANLIADLIAPVRIQLAKLLKQFARLLALGR